MPRHSPYALFCLNFLFGSHISELLEFQNMGFIFSHLKGFPFSALFVIPPCGEIVVFVTLNFRKDLDLFDFAIVVTFANLEISSFFLTICSFLYSFFIRFSMNRSSAASPLVGLGGLEPPTSRLSGARSNHLSYRPLLLRQSK